MRLPERGPGLRERAEAFGTDDRPGPALRPRFCEADEEIIYRLATELLDRHCLTDDTFAAALDRFGDQGVVDAVRALAGFSMAAMVVAAFQIGPAGGAPFSSGPDRRRW